MELFKLVGKVFVDSKEAQDSISKTGSKAEMLKNSLVGGVATAAKFAAGMTAAATAVGGAMVAAAKSTAAEMDVVDKASQRMKIGAEAYQELAYAANLSGVEMSTLEKAAKKLEGTDLNLDDALNQIMACGTEAERSAKAAELFGDSVAYQMTPLLNAGADGLQAMRDEANNLGLVMSQTAVSDGAAMNDMFTKIEASMAALKNSLAAEFMPYVMEIMQWVIDNLPSISAAVKRVLDAIMPIVKPVLSAVMAAVQALFALINGDFEGFSDAIQNVLVNLGDALYQLGKNAIQFLWDGMKSVWASISDWVSEKVNWLANKLAFWKSSTSQMDDAAYGGAYSSYSTTNSRTSNTAQTSQNINISLDLDGATLARKTYNYNQAESRRRGGNLVTA